MTIDEQLCEYNKMMTEIEKLKEASQYFTCRGHIEVYTKLDEAIGEAEAVAYAKRYWMVREARIESIESELQQAYTTIR